MSDYIGPEYNAVIPLQITTAGLAAALRAGASVHPLSAGDPQTPLEWMPSSWLLMKIAHANYTARAETVERRG